MKIALQELSLRGKPIHHLSMVPSHAGTFPLWLFIAATCPMSLPFAMRNTAWRLLILLATAFLAIAMPSEARAQDLRGTVEAGSVGNEADITVTNTSAVVPVEGLRLTVVGAPRFLANVRISPESVVSVPPGQSQAFTVAFDVLPDAPDGQAETVSFQITAEKGAKIDPSRIIVTVEFEKRPEQPATPAQTTARTPPLTPPAQSVPRPPSGTPTQAPGDEYDWYVITREGIGLGLDESVYPAALNRKRVRADAVVRRRRGERIDVAQIRSDILAHPYCEGVHTDVADYWEQLNVSTSVPFDTSEKAYAEMRRRPQVMQVIETIPNIDPKAVKSKFGCGGTIASGSTASIPPGVAVAHPSTTAAPPVDPNALDPNDANMAGLIRTWIGQADPPDNARGARFRYDEWGRVHGTGINGELVTAGRRPDAASGMSSPQYLWTLRDQLDSVDHCTLGQYVLASLQNQSVNDCQGRYRRPAPQLVAAPNVTGHHWQDAQNELQRAGFETDLVGGDPPTSEAEGNKVQWQKPKAGESVAPGSKVQIAIRPPYVEPKKIVPEVGGLAWGQAQQRLRAAGFEADLVGGDPAPTRAQESTVQRENGQKPAAGTMLAPGEKVTVRIHTAYVPPRVDPPAGLQPPRINPPPPVVSPRGDPPVASPLSPALPPPPSQQAQQCNDLVNRANAANSGGRFQEALNYYSRARLMNCNIPGLDNAIANVQGALQRQQQQQQQAQQCSDLVNRGNEARNSGRLQDAVNHYSQARKINCPVPWLNDAITQIQNQQRQSQTKTPPSRGRSPGTSGPPVQGPPQGGCQGGILGQGC